MCTNNDPYYRQYSVLVHEFGHTIHQYALPGSSDYYNRVGRGFSSNYQRSSTIAQWVERSPLRRETRVQFPAESVV